LLPDWAIGVALFELFDTSDRRLAVWEALDWGHAQRRDQLVQPAPIADQVLEAIRASEFMTSRPGIKCLLNLRRRSKSLAKFKPSRAV
jgi:hypothetical protein